MREIAVGRGDQPHVHGCSLSEPMRCSWPFCSTRSSFACTASGSSPTSSRKSVPPSASSNLPRRSADGARERAAHVAEQLALDQRLGQGRAVQADERLARARRERVDRSRDQFLADARLARDEHRQVARRDDRDLVQQTLVHGRAAPDHLAGLRAPLASRYASARSCSSSPCARALDALDHARPSPRRGSGMLRSDADVDAVEARRVERVERQQAPRPAADESGQPEAVVHFEIAGDALHEAVVGIGQRPSPTAKRVGPPAPATAAKRGCSRNAKAPAERVARSGRRRRAAPACRRPGAAARSHRWETARAGSAAAAGSARVGQIARQVLHQRHERVEQLFAVKSTTIGVLLTRVEFDHHLIVTH